jgi:hypothetical protein
MLLQTLRFKAGVLAWQVSLAVVQLVPPIDYSE